MSDHTIVIIWVVKIFFLYSFSVYSCQLFLISSASVRSISVVYCAHLCMKCSLGVSKFLEEISSLCHSVVFLYFFALTTEEGFLISPCYSLELCFQMGISFLFLLCFLLLFVSQLFVRPPQTAILLFAFLFHLDPCLLYNVTNLRP